VAIAAHELLASELPRHGVFLRRVGVIDGNKIPLRVAPVSKISRPLLERRNTVSWRRHCTALGVSLIVEEGVGLSPVGPRQPGDLDRAADRATVVVLYIFGSLRNPELPCVQHRVAVILVQRPVKCVGS